MKNILLLLALTAAAAFGQSAVARQGANNTFTGTNTFTGPVDATAATTTKPIKSGTTLPATCATTELFYDSDATAGQNIYACTSTNTWTLETGGGGGGGATAAYQLTDFGVVKTSATVETINSTASASTPITFVAGVTAYTFTATATATISGSSSTGSVFWCFRPTDGTLRVRHNLAATITGAGLTVDTGQTSCGTDRPLWTTTMTSNVWDTISPTMDKRGVFYAKPSPTGGTGIIVTPGAVDTITVDTTALAGNWHETFGGPMAVNNPNSGFTAAQWDVVTTGSDILPYLGSWPTHGITFKNTADAGVADYIRRYVRLPTGFTASATFNIVGYTSSTAGNVRYALKHGCSTVGANFYAPTFSATINGNTVASAANYTTAALNTWTLDLSACSAGQYLHLWIWRDNAVGSNMADWSLVIAASLY